MVSRFYIDSFVSTCALVNRYSLMGGSTILSVSTRLLIVRGGGRVRGCPRLVGIVIHYILLYIMVEIGGLSLIIG